MKVKHYVDVPGCPVEVTLDLIDGRWKGVVLFHLLDAGCLRFNELHRRVPDITARLLTKQLRDLEEAGLVSRTVYAVVPPRVEYRVSQEGESLRPIVEMLSKWGEARLERQRTKQAATHARRTVSRNS
ncbi:transcriptional regulator [Mesorhizobium sp. M6A.T.Ca.TU.002.02.2.1]|uniref:winged helix-turn-helix transcriptional regulator n=1 Tax=unclassified Mesorhizobium TaxID=325217 RepID=UPI000FD593FA|nr:MULTISPECIES: helix-turn-helix domain-containing protein [unclassified Mesorhizobium]RUU40821.1 transcriptional regulator [Mesorhizobium sp. M6A.T.Ca.TU.002.02.2.1]RUV02746.1 transcriptional regulator [Mesorhizobium sp. M6A.T.Cr.TU.017.01.1.1]RWP52089.1 MAG: transcriptional regulator [Mesorhizobium sp.]